MPTPAIFLSYARDDAGAARRIAEALRSSGVEVWFDENELRGGDAWDSKIKKQIRECALFLPVISAHTNARAEGYFRLEWLLAVERSRLMADDAAFFLPVVIDETTDAGARVPDRFRDLQWTRIGSADSLHAFCERVKLLLGGGEVTPAFQSVGPADPGGKARATPKVGRRVSAAVWAVAIAVVVIAAVFISPINSASTPPDSEKSATPQPALSLSNELSAARQLAAKADAMFDQNEDVPPATLEFAEGLCLQAVALDPQDGEVRAVHARLLTAYISMGYDRSLARRAAARTQAELAAKLAPNSDYVQVVLANIYRHDANTETEAERILRAVIARQPNHKLAWRTLGHLLRESGRYEESLPAYTRAVDLPGGDPLALYNLFISLRALGRFDEAGAALDRAIALHPHGLFLVQKSALALRRGDLPAARAILEKVPGSAQIEPLNISQAVTVWLYSREPKKVLSLWNSVAQDYVDTSLFSGPKDYVTGQALWMDDRRDAALNAWRAALRVVEQRLATQPNSADLVGWKVILLWRLGDEAGARQALAFFRQVLGSDRPSNWLNLRLWAPRLELGERDEVINLMKQYLQANPMSGFILFSPELDGVRNEPWFQALLAESDGKK